MHESLIEDAMSNPPATNDAFTLVIRQPWSWDQVLFISGNFFLLAVLIAVVVVFIVQMKRLFFSTGETSELLLARTSDFARVLGWLGLIVGFSLSWSGLVYVWREYSYAEPSRCMAVFPGYIHAIMPVCFGILILSFCQLQAAIVEFMAHRVRRKGE